MVVLTSGYRQVPLPLHFPEQQSTSALHTAFFGSHWQAGSVEHWESLQSVAPAQTSLVPAWSSSGNQALTNVS